MSDPINSLGQIDVSELRALVEEMRAIQRQFFAGGAFFQTPTGSVTIPDNSMLTVQDVSGSPTFPGINTLEFDQADDGVTVSSPSGGTALVRVPTTAVTDNRSLILFRNPGSSTTFQTIPNASATVLSFDQLTGAGPFTATTAPNYKTITCNTFPNAMTLVTAHIELGTTAPATDTHLTLTLQDNLGNPLVNESKVWVAGGTATDNGIIEMAVLLFLPQAQTLQLVLFQESGSAVAIGFGGTGSASFAATNLGK